MNYEPSQYGVKCVAIVLVLLLSLHLRVHCSVNAPCDLILEAKAVSVSNI